MAERANAPSKKTQDPVQDVGTLQKRGRRRLVGAIALVLLAVIILPMVFDPEPLPNAPLVSVRIPGEDSTKFTPKVAPKPAAPEPLAVEKKAAEIAAEPTPAPALAPAPKAETENPVREPAKPAEKPAAKAGEKSVASAPANEQFMVQVGAFASPDKVKEITDQLKEAKLPHYTESVATAKGTVTRVRLGPFSSKDAAEKALERAKALGLNPGPPATR